MMGDGVEAALADADLALDQLAPESGWIPDALLIRGVAHALLGETDRAKEDLTAAIEKGLVVGAVEDVFVAQAHLALLAAKQGAWTEAGERARAAQALVDEAGLGDYSTSAIAHARPHASRCTTRDARMPVRR
jgi:LuxR family transcriptional regulator, maltose regulon positive regulatory protein